MVPIGGAMIRDDVSGEVVTSSVSGYFGLCGAGGGNVTVEVIGYMIRTIHLPQEHTSIGLQKLGKNINHALGCYCGMRYDN